MTTITINKSYSRLGNLESVLIRAEYNGGAYIDISFGFGQPSEVINVWDYLENKPEIENTGIDVKRTLLEWIKDMDKQEIQDARDEGVSELDIVYLYSENPHPRIWLRAYVDNA